MEPTVAIIDYGTGNVASLEAAFRAVGAKAFLASSPQDLQSADALVLPGVGHFGPASDSLRSSGLWEQVIRLVHDGLPTLGICLGFQLLTRSSEEAPQHPGLGLLPDHRSSRIRPADPRRHKVPHLGWNNIETCTGNSRLLRAIPPDQQLFYFANAYGVKGAPTAGSASYGFYRHDQPWLGLLEQGNICGVQFHPEKSRRQGLQLLHNFLMG